MWRSDMKKLLVLIVLAMTGCASVTPAPYYSTDDIADLIVKACNGDTNCELGYAQLYVGMQANAAPVYTPPVVISRPVPQTIVVPTYQAPQHTTAPTQTYPQYVPGDILDQKLGTKQCATVPDTSASSGSRVVCYYHGPNTVTPNQPNQ
jgi:hypothetical protein